MKRFFLILSLVVATTISICSFGARAQQLIFTANCNGNATHDTAWFTTNKITVGAVNNATFILPYKLNPTQRCTVNTLTLPANLTLDNTTGSGISVVTGQILTVTGPVIASPVKTFYNAIGSQGTVVLNTSIVAYPQWWGGKPDGGVTANQSFISAALNSGAGRVELASGDWHITAPISWTNIFVTLHGASRLNTYISAPGGIASMIKFEGANGGGGGYRIEGIRFISSMGNFTGYAIDATVNSFIDSTITDCWFGFGSAALGSFNGKAVNVIIDSNTFELGANTLHFTLGSYLRITNNFFWECYQNVVDLDGTSPGYINHVLITSNDIDFHHSGTGIHAKNATNVVIDDLVYVPNDDIADLVNYFPIVLDLDNAEVIASNIKMQGALVYLASDPGHVGTAYMKIKYGVQMLNSTLKLSNSVFNMSQSGINLLAGTVDLDVDDVKLDSQSTDGITIAGITGKVFLNNSKFNKPTVAWLNMVGTISADMTIQNCQFSDARWNGGAASGAVLKTTGNFSFNGNKIIRTSATSAVFDFLDLTFVDGMAFLDNNTFIASPALGGAEIKSTSTGYRLGKGFGLTPNSASIYFKGSMPTTGRYITGDIVFNSAPSELGAGGSKYVVTGWKRLTTGTAHVLNTDWVEMRTLTGN